MPTRITDVLNARKARGDKVYTGAYMISAPATKGADKQAYIAETVIGALWRKTFPRLITVPACTPCNERFGLVDERFRIVLSLVLSLKSKAAEDLWESRVKPRIRQGGPASKIVRHNAELGLEISARDHDPMIERLIRVRIPMKSAGHSD